ncbi:MAG: ABC transporter permease subunit [Chthonomonas sp.]|nr:ABC transporter permease subunit [Chthonomonas sp.]
MIVPIGLVAVLGVLATLLGWFFALQLVLTLVRVAAGVQNSQGDSLLPKLGRSALGAALCLGFAQVIDTGAAPKPGLQIPLVWVSMPFTAWFALVGLIVGLVRLAQAAVTHLNQAEKAKLAFGWFAFAGVSYALFRGNPQMSKPFWQASDHKVEMFRGTMDVSLTKALIAVALLVLAYFVMARMERSFRARKVTRTFFTHLTLIAGTIVFGIPFAWLLSTSFKEDKDIVSQQGLSFIPKVAVKVPYLDPKAPEFETRFEGQTVRAQIIERKPDGSVRMDVVKPFSLRGKTFDLANASQMKEVPKMVPLVEGKFEGQDVLGIVTEEKDDGTRTVEIREPASLKGRTFSDLLANLPEVRKVGLKTENYVEALESLPVETNMGLVFLRNTLFLVAANIVGTLFSCTLVAYGFARLRFPGRNFLFSTLMTTMMLPGAVTMLPVFLIWRTFGAVDTLYPLWVGSFFAGAFNVFLIQQFFKSIPMELEDAAKIDGCSYWQALWKVMAPQIKPALAAVAIFTAMGTWNNFQGPLIYINSPELMPISYAVQLFQGAHKADYALMMAFSTMAVIPVLLLFFFGQKYFVEGVTLSGFGGR